MTLVLLSAGGTGGHLFPAEALAGALRARGARVALATDTRAGAMLDAFPADEVVQIAAATPSGRSLVRMAQAALVLGRGYLQARRAIRRLKPAVVVGFGGYPTVPPVFAASGMGVKTLLHEQNGVMGRANRFLAGRVTAIATGFPQVDGVPAGTPAPVHTGNPVRPAVIAAAATPYPSLEDGRLRVLVFGGSQGARVMSEVVPAAVERLPAELRARLVLAQQAREEDLAQVRETYARLLEGADVQPFFKDLPQRMAGAHLVVSRSGASTVAELAVIGRPAILVPLPGALDQDQAANARALSAIGAATVLPQVEFTPERLAAEIVERFHDPQGLTAAAAAAKSAGIADAADRLATLVLRLAQSSGTA
ncbi:MAG TPA: undecaprenyldiphospho-muramoylpentapeptide beta-N-acetylglucosaminyltransferase [Beijerinckiaceae bacterium]|nr:undecaprenyldiphospho-muramoylpentapeptide beta-N-acetylglucosaminyltransferase [Beijerinckiaceae bacterium]